MSCPQMEVYVVLGGMGILLAVVMGMRVCICGYGFGPRSVDGERILEFGDAMEMVVCHTQIKRNAEWSNSHMN